ncbi:MAG: DUF3783 domain-containing protein [Stomatobaculum sp.]|nr:DUF3783 domain-containing protein [Stomatobaculum sp.]
MKSGAQIFTYIPDGKKKLMIKSLCEKIGFFCREIQAADVNKTILELITGRVVPDTVRAAAGGGQKTEEGKRTCAPPLYFLPELILFQGLADQEVHQFLDAYRAAGIPAVDLKAVVTPYNLTWTLYELAEHLKEEHKSMQR